LGYAAVLLFPLPRKFLSDPCLIFSIPRLCCLWNLPPQAYCSPKECIPWGMIPVAPPALDSHPFLFPIFLFLSTLSCPTFHCPHVSSPHPSFRLTLTTHHLKFLALFITPPFAPCDPECLMPFQISKLSQAKAI